MSLNRAAGKIVSFLLCALSAVTVSGQATLVGYARLPAETFREGPPATNSVISWFNKGSKPRWSSQPVQGISSLQKANDGTYWALSDNGFGARINSTSYILSVYHLKFNWKTDTGGAGDVEVIETVEFRDPLNKAGFKITRNDDPMRRLTGADFDPESMVIGDDGSFWIGDEFGPYLLHFSREGYLVEAPLSAVFDYSSKWKVVKSPDRRGSWGSNLPRSRGFEGMAIDVRNNNFYLLLEGPLKSEAKGWLRVFNFVPGAEQVTSMKRWKYPLENEGHSIGELSYWPEYRRFLVLERDWGHGSMAKFKRVFAWQPEAGLRVKQVVADLMAIHDPHRLGSDAEYFAMPYVTLEAVIPIDDHTLLICNDNNFPSTGARGDVTRKDDSEFILLDVSTEIDHQ